MIIALIAFIVVALVAIDIGVASLLDRTPVIAYGGLWRFLLGLPVLFFDGLAVSRVWNWFVVTSQHVHSMSVVTGMGVSLLVAFMTYQTLWSEILTEGEGQLTTTHRVTRIVVMYALPLSLLLFGFLVHWAFQ